jgi:hypothetical protein
LESSQASFEIQPRVFYEDFKNTVIYVQDVVSGAGASNWRKLFIADVTNPTRAGYYDGRDGDGGAGQGSAVGPDAREGVLIRLRNGSNHEMVANQPGQYNISTF